MSELCALSRCGSTLPQDPSPRQKLAGASWERGGLLSDAGQADIRPAGLNSWPIRRSAVMTRSRKNSVILETATLVDHRYRARRSELGPHCTRVTSRPAYISRFPSIAAQSDFTDEFPVISTVLPTSLRQSPWALISELPA